MKRYLYIIIGILVVAIIAIIVILFIKNQANSNGGTTGSLPPAGGQAGSLYGNGGTTTGSSTGDSTGNGAPAASTFNMLFAGPVLNYFMDASGTITAIGPNGIVTNIVGGQSTVLDSTPLTGVISARFSFDGKKILVSFGDPNDPQATVFDTRSRSWTPLPKGILSPVWAPADYRIAYFVSGANGKITLYTLNLANTKNRAVAITTLSAQDLDIAWTGANQFVFYDKPTALNQGSSWIFNAQSQALLPLAINIPGLEGVWNTSGASSSAYFGLIFKSNASRQGGYLQLIDNSGNIAESVRFNTLPSKCTFNNSIVAPPQSEPASSTASSTTPQKPVPPTRALTLYCGIPRDQGAFTNALLPDSYNEKGLFTSDDIYSIDIGTGVMQPLWNDPAQNMDVSHITVNGATIAFINRYDGKLYGITLSSSQ